MTATGYRGTSYTAFVQQMVDLGWPHRVYLHVNDYVILMRRFVSPMTSRSVVEDGVTGIETLGIKFYPRLGDQPRPEQVDWSDAPHWEA